MTTPIDRAAEIVTALRDATGMRVTLDPRNANPPCVLIQPPAVTFNRMCGGAATWTAFAIAPGPWNADAWKVLDALVAGVNDVVVLSDATPDSHATDNAGDLPAYRLTWTDTVQWSTP